LRGTKEGVAMEPSQRKLRWGALNRGELGAAEVALLAKDICINGGTYCRAHLLINCHQCRVDFQGNHDHDNFRRASCGLKPVGDQGAVALPAPAWGLGPTRALNASGEL